MQMGKTTLARVDYAICRPAKCAPESGICPAVKSCPRRVIEQLDGASEPPLVYQNLCQACGECVEACPLDAIRMS